MKVTVSEAKTKRCQESYPASQGISPNGHTMATSVPAFIPPAGSSLAVMVTSAPLYCIGPDCMAWRWAKDETTIDGEFLGYCGKACR